jgi:serine/threonine protein kinase
LGSSLFLQKYFIPINNPNPFPNSVILDYIPFFNLSDFLQFNSAQTFLMNKLSIMFSIIQSLLYLRDYKIVHLDLKPNSIMIYCDLLVKLIDFGESYHPEVCKNRKSGLI